MAIKQRMASESGTILTKGLSDFCGPISAIMVLATNWKYRGVVGTSSLVIPITKHVIKKGIAVATRRINQVSLSRGKLSFLQ